jgi:nucleoside-diphosphate-sugar epimerase
MARLAAIICINPQSRRIFPNGKFLAIPTRKSMSTVLVTGGSGFIGSHAILQLLAAGHQVRTTVRNLSREAEVRARLQQAGANPADLADRLTFFAADLQSDAGWPQGVAGCDYVLHVASPFPLSLPKHEDDLIIPAREGALRVLRAARDADVHRVVLTSSFAAIGYGHTDPNATFDEATWSNPNGPGILPYPKSKTLAERAAWDFIAREGGKLELSVVNPVAVFGPVLSRDYAPSIVFIQRLLDGQLPGVPRLTLGVVDVRDVADLHIRAMTHPDARGQRFIALAGDFVSMLDIAKILKSRMGAAAKRVPTREIPNWSVRLYAQFDPDAKQILPDLGKKSNGTSVKAQRVLGWLPRPADQAIVATAESLIRLGLVKDSQKAAA